MKKILLLAVFVLAMGASTAYYYQSHLATDRSTRTNNFPFNKPTGSAAQSKTETGATPAIEASNQASPASAPQAESHHQCEGCSTFPARHPTENRELSPVEKYSMVHNHFPPDITVATLPDGHFKVQLQALPEAIQQKVLKQLVEDKTPTINLNSLHIADDGVLLFACRAPDPREAPKVAAAETTELHPQATNSFVPISSPPALSSRPGSSNIIYLDFNGHIVTNTAWGATTWDCLPFDMDGDTTTFSPTEQSAIIRIWEQVVEDYAPFNVNVTTIEPATFTNRTARALITRSTDRNGINLPYHTAGGVAYINVFGTSLYARYSPAFIYHNRLSNVASHIADAVTHEVGHNLGLYHDGIVAQGDFPALEYYSGHGFDELSWGPIMGSPYWKNFSQWSKGEYFRANNLEDDFSKIGFKLGYRPDVEGSELNQAAEITGPVKGVIDYSSDKDIWWAQTFSTLTIAFSSTDLGSGGARGGNLLGAIDIFNESGALVESILQGPAASLTHSVSVPPGKYFIQVRNQSHGSPLLSPPTGFTLFGSLGQYSLNVATDQHVANPLDHFWEWSQSNLGNGSADPNQRINAEPLTNFERYAYNLPQGTANPETKLPTTGVSGNSATVSFRIGQPDKVIYRVLESRDLINWEEVDISTNTIASNQETGATKITVRTPRSGLPVFFKVLLSPVSANTFSTSSNLAPQATPTPRPTPQAASTLAQKPSPRPKLPARPAAKQAILSNVKISK
jgi:hypothetical protein